MENAYRLAPLTWSERTNPVGLCAICGHEDLRHPVKLETADGSTVWAGTGCAANLILGRQDRVARTEIRRLARELTEAHAAEAQRAGAEVAAVEAQTYRAWLGRGHGPRRPAGRPAGPRRAGRRPGRLRGPGLIDVYLVRRAYRRAHDHH